MKVYKATDADMTCHMGKGIFQYHLGVPAKAPKSKCGSIGLHACEYILDCLSYYSLGDGHRFFAAEAAGDIAEDGANTRISCTELTLIQELSNKDIAREAMLYMINHPRREGWQHAGTGAVAARDTAQTGVKDGIAIARGPEPKAKGCAGAHLGFLREAADGGIRAAKLVTVSGPIRPDTWYTLGEAEDAIRQAAEAAETR